MANVLSRLLRRRPDDHGGDEETEEKVRGDITALAGVLQEQMRPLTRRIEGARGSLKPAVLADLAAYDETLPPNWRGVATDAALLASIPEIDRALRAEMEAGMAPSDDEAVRRRQRDVQQVIALVEGHAQPDPTHPVEEWHQEAADLIDDAFVAVAVERTAEERAAAEAAASAPPTMDEIRRMVDHTSAVAQVANLVEGRPTPGGVKGPGRRHRAIATAIGAIFARHGGPVKTPLLAADDDASADDDAPGGSPRPMERPVRDPDSRAIPRLVRAHIPDRPMDTDERDALVRAVKTALAFGRPSMKRRVTEAVGARCAARGLSPERITRAQEVAGLVTAGFSPRSLAATAASLDARGATPYQKAVGLASDVIVTMTKRTGARLGSPEELGRTVADLADDPAYYLDLYALAADVERTPAPLSVALPPDEDGWRADAAAIIRDVVNSGGR